MRKLPMVATVGAGGSESSARGRASAQWNSTVALSAEQFQRAIRGHWTIENQRQHQHVRDVVMQEDACRIREPPLYFCRSTFNRTQLHAG